MFQKKAAKPKRNHDGKSLAQYGLFEIPSDFTTGLEPVDDDGGDSDYEAELAALAGEIDEPAKPKRPPRRVIPQSNLDAMVADSMKDIPSDAELSGDDDDPELLNELNLIAGNEEPVEAAPVVTQPEPPSAATGSTAARNLSTLLNTRLQMYEIAEKNAKQAGEASKARRFSRAQNTLKGLIRDCKAGRPVNEADIPPEVSTGVKKPAEAPVVQASEVNPVIPEPSINPHPEEPSPVIPEASPASPQPETPSQNKEILDKLFARQKEYKIVALKAKKSGDTESALNYLKIAKMFDVVIASAQRGEAVDLSDMPESPLGNQAKPKEKIEENQVQKDSAPEPQPGLITGTTVLEALEQRLAVYKKQEDSAKEQGNASKVRRLGRIVKQFEDAIKLHKAGKNVAFDELPTPPGYGPIPGAAPKQEAHVVEPTPKAPEDVSEPAETRASPPKAPSTSRISGNHMSTTRADKQLAILLAKQKQFKIAALNAKKKGEISQAKELLRTAKGFDKLIEASRDGLPVDWSSIPVSPEGKSQLENEYDVVMADECIDDDTTNIDVLARLETQLTRQLKVCLSTRDHHKALGDVAGMNRFERLALAVTKDLDIVRVAHRTPGAKIPKYHYENKDFSIVKSFTELGDNDLELLIVRGVNYTSSNPKEIDTYVKFEFPFPQETPYCDKTAVVKDTNNPEYNSTFTVPIQRTSRACQRIFKRHGIKCEVYSKGGFFRSDTLLGTATVKLQPLETQCELHDSFDLLEGRKKVGGKLEVRIRLRHPIVTQQVEQIHEKWLIIDQ